MIRIFASLFALACLGLALVAGTHYEGHWIVYAVFTLTANALLFIGFRRQAIYFDTFIGIFLCYAVLDPISNMMKQLVKEEMSNMEAVKVVLVTHLSGKPELVSIDAGRRLIQLNIKPSFAQLESWVNQLEESPGV